jgi:tryptophanyl-tRNA synthetase
VTKTVFSGIQSTGNVHIGNYIGALRNWVDMQETYDAIYCVVDLHSITVPYQPDELRYARLDTAKILLAVGVDPDRSLLYFQSDVPQHTELCWILGTITGMGPLNRMTQYKEKTAREGALFGLFAYPVLQAADILIHKADVVPVGEDQSQHIELTRDLAERFNRRFGAVFPIPERITPEIGARIMSLKDPAAKMSKSDPDPDALILVTDSPEEIRRKLKAAVTDSEREIRYDPVKKPGISNLLEIVSVFVDRPIDDLVAEYLDMPYASFKDLVAEAVVEGLASFQRSYASLDDRRVAEIMDKGAQRGRDRAEQTMVEVRERTGLR